MATCDTLEVDLSRVDYNITLEQYPCIDVEILQPDITIEAVTVANQGPKGDQGPIGPTGPIGPVGPSGPIGPTGAQGVQGPAGPKGDLGPQGATGPQGAQGVAGPQGAQGVAGPQGAQGPVGPQGPIGQGLTPKGTVANSGSLPASGNTAGDIWITSDTGHGWSWDGTKWVDMGPFQGPVGATGSQGPAGATGATGATGPQGPKGADSTVPGPQGPQGATGSQGPQGATGAAGAAATIAVGTTTTGTPGTNAVVANSGTSAAAVFNFTIPAGVQGAAGAQGSTGPQGPPGPTAVSTDTGNIATLGSDSKILVPQSQIWSVRLRSFNALSAGNPTFEVDQRNVGNSLTNPANSAFVVDRWSIVNTPAFTFNSGQITGYVVLPGTSFAISQKYLRVLLVGQKTSLGVSDILGISQAVEGPLWRELSSDVTSCSLLVRSSVANLKFTLLLRDGGTAVSLVKLCTIPTANVWALIPLPNLPIPTGGTFNSAVGVVAYYLNITLAAGANQIAPATDTWQSGNFYGAPGMSNFAASPVNSTFDLAYISHEPGAQASNPPIDCPFTQNYDDCLRYYQKSYPYSSAIGSTGTNTFAMFNSMFAVTAPWNVYSGTRFFKPMAKVPTCVAYNPSTGAANSCTLWYASSGTVPNASAAQPVATVLATSSGINYLQFSAGASTAPTWALAEWTADTGL